MQTSYLGPQIDDLEILSRLPANIARTFESQNGFISVEGGLHVRGACQNPMWHSIRTAWEGEFAISRLYPMVEKSDIPLAEDCFGNQYLLRKGKVIRLLGETGELDNLDTNWEEFIARFEAATIDSFQLFHLARFREEGGELHPGFLLSVYPPFIAKECVGPSLRPIPALECRSYLADFARQIKNLNDGQRIKVKVAK